MNAERLLEIDRRIKRYESIDVLLDQIFTKNDQDVGNQREEEDAVLQDLKQKKVRKLIIIIFLNIYSYYRFLDSELPVERFNFIFIDGLLQVKLHNFFYKKKINRSSFDFSSLANDCFKYIQRNNLKIALIGARTEENTNAVKVLCNKYNDLSIVYSRNGYFHSEDEWREMCNILKEKEPDIVMLGMGTPEQEAGAIYLSEHGVLCTIITCGGFITQTAKRPDYYRPFVKKFNLRWLQRVIEFKHIRRRLFIDYPRNITRYFLDHIVLFLKKY
jgi:N-acetylglucosaminyldiphosphoundecaprenol N-acetyl-beta-D-mannosaminyltransferase